jgi:Carbohydrate esterase, sialic acid-specific acetylesterase
MFRTFGRASGFALVALSFLHCSGESEEPFSPGVGGGTGAGAPDIASGGQVGAGGTSGGVAASGGSETASGGALGTGGETTTPPTPKKRAFLLLGQSNMAGYPQALSADKVEDPRVQVLGYDACGATGRKTDEWDTASPPLHACWSGALGPGDYFAKGLIASLPEDDTVGLVPCAIPGEKIETFLKVGGSKYAWILGRAKKAQEAGYEIEGILFHQGESNCGDPNWPGKVKTLVSDLRSDLGLGDVPFLPGELLYTGCGNHNKLINQLPGLIENTHVVSAAGLVVASDDEWKLHFSHDSVVTQGGRYAEAMKAALGL